jgi:uncharacterized membrane protein
MQQSISEPQPNTAIQREQVSGLRGRSERRARALGLFSIGLGLTQLVAPRAVAALIGMREGARSRRALRLIAVRELVAGVGLLAQPRSAGWVWSRVAGDAIDLALLGHLLRRGEAARGRLLASTAAVAGIAALDAVSAARLSRSAASQVVGPVHVLQSITVNRSPEEVYAFWHDLENLPRFMAHLESVKVTNGRSTWRAKGPAGVSISWQAEVVLDRPNECIAWKSVEGSTSVPNRGVVRFSPAPGRRGTEVQVELKYEPPVGAIGAAVAKLFGEEPNQQIKSDLRRLKQVLETGEVVHSDASIRRGPHPARPSQRINSSEKGAGR